MPPRPSSSTMRRCRRWSRSRMPFCRTPRRSGRRRGAISRSSSTVARSARWKLRSATPPMSWNASWSTTASSPRRWRHAVRWGEFDASSGRLHLTASAAGAHAIRDLLADGVFRIGREKLRVSIPDVGGGFGMKNVLYPEWVLVLWAARRLGRPVTWIGDRSEDFTGSVHGRDSLDPGPPCARSRRPLPRARHKSPRQSGRLCLDGGAGRADHGDGERDGRRLRHSADRLSDQRRVHQHDAGRRLSRRRQARGELSDRALHRHRGRSSSAWMR